MKDNNLSKFFLSESCFDQLNTFIVEHGERTPAECFVMFRIYFEVLRKYQSFLFRIVAAERVWIAQMKLPFHRMINLDEQIKSDFLLEKYRSKREECLVVWKISDLTIGRLSSSIHMFHSDSPCFTWFSRVDPCSVHSRHQRTMALASAAMMLLSLHWCVLRIL